MLYVPATLATLTRKLKFEAFACLPADWPKFAIFLSTSATEVITYAIEVTTFVMEVITYAAKVTTFVMEIVTYATEVITFAVEVPPLASEVLPFASKIVPVTVRPIQDELPVYTSIDNHSTFWSSKFPQRNEVPL